MKTTINFFAILLLIASMGCSKDDPINATPPIAKEPLKSSAKQITSFAFDVADNAALDITLAAVINEDDKTIKATVAHGTDLTAFTPTIVSSNKASVSPTGAQDFSSPVVYTITAEDNTNTKYTATITPAPNSEKAIINFQFLLSENPFDVNVISQIDEENKLITFEIPDGADISALLPNIQISNNATISPEGVQNFEEPVIYTVTGEDGSTTTYEVRAILSQRAILLAIYIANPDNTLDWDIESTNISTWEGVTTDADGAVSGLILKYNNLSILPPEIGNLTHLTELSLYGNQLLEIPSEIGNLTNLTYLRLSNNQLTVLPTQIGNLTNLTYLAITDNELTQIPSLIKNLTNLSFFYLSFNELTAIPSEIGNLTNLSELDLVGNHITIIPAEIGQLVNLTHLRLNLNSIEELPSQIGNLTSLTILNLARNQLTQLPSEIGNLTNLTKLNLSTNQLTEIPIEIGNLTKLTRLDLNTNQLTEIPSEIGNLTNLDKLYLQENLLITIPQAVCDLETNHGTIIQIDAGVTCE